MMSLTIDLILPFEKLYVRILLYGTIRQLGPKILSSKKGNFSVFWRPAQNFISRPIAMLPYLRDQ